MANTPTIQYQGVLSVGAETAGFAGWGEAIGAFGEQYAYVSSSLACNKQIIEREAIRGYRDHVSTDTREGLIDVSGTIVLEPTYAEVSAWLTRALGSSTAVTEVLPSFRVQQWRYNGTKGTSQFNGCKVNRCTISGSQGQLLRFSFDIVGKDETLTSAAQPTIAWSDKQPYIFHDCVFTLGGTARPTQSFELTIDNGLITDRYMNSKTRTALPEGDRVVTLRTTHPHDSDGTNADLLDMALAGIEGTLVITNANSPVSISFTFGQLQAAHQTPTSESRNSESLIQLNMVARMDAVAGNKSIAMVIDSTP